jgi:hypothetical protein
VSEGLDSTFQFDESAFFAAHRAVPAPAFPDADPQDAVSVRARTLPRHRARRRQWKPPVSVSSEADLQSVEPQHLHHGDTFVR